MAVQFGNKEQRERYDKVWTYIFKVNKRQHKKRLNETYVIAKLDTYSLGKKIVNC
jgi:hypothetical protein